MKIVIGVLSIFVLISCSSRQPSSWDDGAQKQEAIQEQTQVEQQETLRNQFPGARPY